MSLLITRRAPGYRAAFDPIKRPTVHSGDAIRQYRETGPPILLKDARDLLARSYAFLVTSTVLNLRVLPTLALRFGRFAKNATMETLVLTG